MLPVMSTAPSIVLFDGHCNLCQHSVLFIIKRDRSAHFQFAAIQSDQGQNLLVGAGGDPASLETMILLEDGLLYDRSTAALRICRKLDRLWPLLFIFIIIPRPARDVIYRWIARNRYRWFGRKEECLVPTPDLKARFL